MKRILSILVLGALATLTGGASASAAGQICGGGAMECFAGETCMGGTCQPTIPPRAPGNPEGPSTPRAPSLSYVSIAYSVSTGKVGYGISSGQRGADARAAASCNQRKNGSPPTRDCAVVGRAFNGCVAMAWDPRGAKSQYGIGNAPNERTAKRRALQSCGNGRCVVGPWGCTAGH